MVSQIAVTNKKQGDFTLLAQISLIHNVYVTLATEVLLHFDAENTQENIPLLLNDFIF